MHTRLAQLEDLPQLVALGKMLLQLHGEFDPRYYQLEESFDEQFGSFLKQHIDHPYQFVIVAYDDKESPTTSPVEIHGFISGFVKSLYPWFTTKSVGHISYLITHPNIRRSGIGKMLEETAIVWFKEKNVRYAEVYTDEKNTIGGVVWNKLGYQPFKKFLRKTL